MFSKMSRLLHCPSSPSLAWSRFQSVVADSSDVIRKRLGKPNVQLFSSSPSSRTKEPSLPFDEETDVLTIGSGAGALTTSLRLSALGQRSIVAEKEDIIGGSSALSGGGLWVPCNSVSRDAGAKDSEQLTLKYFEQADQPTRSHVLVLSRS